MTFPRQLANPRPLLWTLIVLYAVAFSWMALARHEGLKTQLADLGNMDQAIHQTLQGNFMANTSGGDDNGVRIGGHANWILLFFVPFYALGAGPWFLLIAQCIGVALAAWPIARFTERRVRNPWMGVAMAAAFLLNPMVHDATLYDFHPEVLAMVFVAAAFLALDERRTLRFAIFAGLLLLVKEDFPLLVVMFGLYSLVVQRRWRLGTITVAVGLSVFILNVSVLMPLFKADVTDPGVLERYGELGSSVGEIATNVLSDPGAVIRTLLSPSRVTYVLTLVLPFAFLPLVGLPVLALAAPSLLINMLSQAAWMHHPFGFYYSASILPLLALATSAGLATIIRRWPTTKYGETLIIAIALSTLTFTVLTSPIPYSPVSSFAHFAVPEHASQLSRIAAVVPPDASLSVQNNLGAHLSHRAHIYVFPQRAHDADYVLVDAWDPNVEFQGYRQWHWYMSAGRPLIQYAALVQSVFDDPHYGLVAQDGTYFLFQRGASRERNEEANEFFRERIETMKVEFIERYGAYYDQIISDPRRLDVES